MKIPALHQVQRQAAPVPAVGRQHWPLGSKARGWIGAVALVCTASAAQAPTAAPAAPAAALLAAPDAFAPPKSAAAPGAAPAPALAQSYQRGSVELAHYWVSEKYDGVRALWDGRRLLSRQGLPIRAPAWFTAGWPATPMDGELWAGRGRFADAQSAVAQTVPVDTQWRTLRYMVFDLPAHPGSFDQRLPALNAHIAGLHQPWVQAVAQWRVAGHDALMAQLARYEKAGAEGLMLRRGDAPHRAGRSGDLLKVKSFEDAEGVVVAHLPGQGKYAGQTGALLVELPDGQRLRLGSGLTDALRRAPPPLGSTVTYRYNGLHAGSGLPRFARFWRVRADVPPPGAPAQDSSKKGR
ncbi:DNA ligase-1 [Oryzisolibacter propanilivorax]|uniref:DNA ligase-1 n=1 Tax=Oryzisolibacter propanilivorax TaxID=1527607 RepID=A0A1G9SLY6_9BURK|nr:DNA ligase [Oryzisolibacter propanilivorax]SDM36488.1 DNA ligase-1 [Oryzisolibacter propanilivorax]